LLGFGDIARVGLGLQPLVLGQRELRRQLVALELFFGQRVRQLVARRLDLVHKPEW